MKGFVHPKFWRVGRSFETQLKLIKGGAAVCVYHKGEPVVDIWGGVKDKEGNPWEEDTLAMCYSTTKGVTSTLMHILVGKGLIDYEAPVSKYWPEFGQKGKEAITIRHLMCHEAGLYNIRNVIDDFDATQDWKYMAHRLTECEPSHRPGQANGYHALTYGWLLGEIIERVTRKQFSEIVYDEIVKPLELDGFYVGLPPEQMHRVADVTSDTCVRLVQLAEKYTKLQIPILPKNFPVSLRRLASALLTKNVDRLVSHDPDMLAVSMPAANGVFTARSLAKMYAALAGGGHLNGVHLISPEQLRQATRVQNRRVDRVVALPLFWRMGFHSIPSAKGMLPKAFGHFGLGGSAAWADPEHEISVAMTLADDIVNPIAYLHSMILGDAVLRSA
ncbi:serine hydrolase domain-containing protein [Deltaproteobacteria bacterium TL4]